MTKSVAKLNLNRKKYLEEYKLYNNKKALELLILTYIPTAQKIAEKYRNKGIEYEDLISIGTLHLIEIINSYDMEKKSSLSLYVINKLNRKYSSEIAKVHESVSYEEYSNQHKNGEDGLCYDNLLEETLKLICPKAINESMEHRLDDKKRMILNLRYGLNGNYIHKNEEISKLLGISVKRTRELEGKALKLLFRSKSRKKLEDFID